MRQIQRSQSATANTVRLESIPPILVIEETSKNNVTPSGFLEIVYSTTTTTIIPSLRDY